MNSAKEQVPSTTDVAENPASTAAPKKERAAWKANGTKKSRNIATLFIILFRTTCRTSQQYAFGLLWPYDDNIPCTSFSSLGDSYLIEFQAALDQTMFAFLTTVVSSPVLMAVL